MEIIYIVLSVIISALIIAGIVLVCPWFVKDSDKANNKGKFVFSTIFSEEDSNIMIDFDFENGEITDEQYRTRGSVRIAQGGGMDLTEFEEEKKKELMIPLP